MRLISDKTGKEIKPGDRVTTFRGEPCTVVDMYPPTHAPSTGRVVVKFDGHTQECSFYPGVIAAKWVEEGTRHGQA